MKKMQVKYPNLTVTFLIEYDSKFLLILRDKKESNFPSLWAFTGGKAEIGETAIDTIFREVFEETGLILKDEGAFLNSYCFKNSVGIAFVVRAKSNNLKLSKEIKDYVWVRSLDDLKMYKCIPGIYNHLKNAISILADNKFESLSEMNLTQNKYINI